MRLFFLKSFLTVNFLIYCLGIYSQDLPAGTDGFKTIIDSLKKSGVVLGKNDSLPEIKLSRDQAISFLQKKTRAYYWLNQEDPLRKALDHLVFEASTQKYDSIAKYLVRYPYDSLSIPWDKFYIWEPMKIKIPTDAVPGTDSLALSASRDTTIMVIIDTLESTTSNRAGFPFRYFDYPYQGDSIKVAVRSLLDYVQQRDSMIINFAGAGRPVPVWLNTRSPGTMRRYWLKNEYDDSVTVWIGNEGRNTIGLYLENGINFRKPMKQSDYSQASINVQKMDRSTLEKQNIVIKKQYWRYRTESSMVFSQSALSNWVKGGENSVSTALDITGYGDFNRPELKLSSSNFARLKLGFLASGGNDIRKNLDLLETNSKLNHKAFGKFDFSAIMLFKTQVAVGKIYKKQGEGEVSEVVSRFMNPAILTLGIGLDYKPDKETSINFSPLSYKATFVPGGRRVPTDTLRIDQTRYGLEMGKLAKHEPGASFMISKISRPVKNLTVTNRLQLFTNYINNPQNIDVDWEMIAVYNLNWFTDLRFNSHLIFDDDTRTTVMEGGVPVKLEDGSNKKTARIQFKEIFGVSLMFRF